MEKKGIISEGRRRSAAKWDLSYEVISECFATSGRTLRNMAEYYRKGEGRDLLKRAVEIVTEKEFERVVFLGNTFCYYSSIIPEYVLECMPLSGRSRYPDVQRFEITEFYDYILPKECDVRTLYIFVSHSGRSRLILKTLEHLHTLKFDKDLIWLVTAAEPGETPAEQYCGAVFPTKIGNEVVLGTKSFKHSASLMSLLAAIIADPETDIDSHLTEIEKVADLIDEDSEFGDRKTVERMMHFTGYDYSFLYIIGKGVTMSTVYSMALGAKGFTGIYAEGIPLGIFYHGAFQVADNNFRGLVVMGDDPTDNTYVMLPRLLKLTAERFREGRIILITDNRELADKCGDINILKIVVPYKCGELLPVAVNYLLERYFLEIAAGRGILTEGTE